MQDFIIIIKRSDTSTRSIRELVLVTRVGSVTLSARETKI